MSRGQIIDEIPQAELSERRIIEAIVGVRVAAGSPSRATP
jgi:hypothetical protein